MKVRGTKVTEQEMEEGRGDERGEGGLTPLLALLFANN